MVKVELIVYDLSRGMVRNMAPLVQSFLGTTLDGIWHTGVLVHGFEYFYGGGPTGVGKMPQGQFTHANKIPVTEIIGINGGTNKTLEEVEQFLRSSEISQKFAGANYDLFTRNCNHFSMDFISFLTDGKEGVPDHILNLPQMVLNTPAGPMIRQLYSSAQNSFAGNGAIPMESNTENGNNIGASSSNGKAGELRKLEQEFGRGCVSFFLSLNTGSDFGAGSMTPNMIEIAPKSVFMATKLDLANTSLDSFGILHIAEDGEEIKEKSNTAVLEKGSADSLIELLSISMLMMEELHAEHDKVLVVADFESAFLVSLAYVLKSEILSLNKKNLKEEYMPLNGILGALSEIDYSYQVNYSNLEILCDYLQDTMGDKVVPFRKLFATLHLDSPDTKIVALRQKENEALNDVLNVGLSDSKLKIRRVLRTTGYDSNAAMNLLL